jgi:4-amino-4-deoxychorismate lyase
MPVYWFALSITQQINYTRAILVFFDGTKWITPSQPLLMGTRRAALLKAGIISEASIQIKDLNKFIDFKLINAMMLWEESPSFKLQIIK